MKKKQSAIFKWLLAVCLFTAGCFYSCGSRETAKEAVSVHGNRAFQAESAPESSTETNREYPEDTEASRENEAALCYVYVCGKVQSPGVYIAPGRRTDLRGS